MLLLICGKNANGLIVDLKTNDLYENFFVSEYLLTQTSSEPNNIKNPTRSLQNVEFKSGMQVKISHINSPKDFYLIPHEMSLEMKAMSQQMSSFYKANSLKLISPKPGLICAICEEDREDWNRVEIIEILQCSQNNKPIELRLIDSGNTIYSTFDELHELDSQFFEFPRFAVKFALAGIEPINDDWTAATNSMKDRFLSNNGNDCTLHIEVVAENEVDMFAYFDDLKHDVARSLHFLKLVTKKSNSQLFQVEGVKSNTGETKMSTQSFHPVEISHSKHFDPNNFEVHYKEFKAAINLMQSLIQKYDGDLEDAETSWAIEDKCLVKCILDGKILYMRAQILSLTGKKARLQMLDEHLKVNVSIKKLKKCPAEFKEIGATYQKVRIAGKFKESSYDELVDETNMFDIMEKLQHFMVQFKDENSIKFTDDNTPRPIALVGRNEDHESINVSEFSRHGLVEDAIESDDNMSNFFAKFMKDEHLAILDLKFREKYNVNDDETVRIALYSVKLNKRRATAWKTAQSLPNRRFPASLTDLDHSTGIITVCETSMAKRVEQVEGIIKHFYKKKPEEHSFKFGVGQPCIAKFCNGE